MHVKRKTYLTVAAVFAFMFLLLLSFIPGGKASAATKTYSVSCTGGTVSYYNSNANYFSNDSRVSIYCSNKGSFTITVKPNTSTSSRTITLYSKKGNGTTVDTLRISQPGIIARTINATCTGGNYSHGIPGAYSISSTNTAICSSLTSDKNYLVIKPYTGRISRSCTVTVKNSVGTIIGRVKINQSPVPTKTINAACTGGNYAHGFSGAYSATSSNTSICSGLTSDKKSLIVKPSTSTSVRNCKVTLKNSAGRIVAYVVIKQRAVSTKTINAACTGGNYTHGISGVYSATSDNTSICSGLTSDKKSLIVKPNTTTSARDCKVTLKNSSSKVIAYVYIKQAAVPVKKVSTSGDSGAKFYYENSNVTNFSYSSSYVSKVTASNPGSFTIYLKENPSPSKTRTFDIIAKNSKGAYVEIIRVTQAKHTVTSITLNVPCTGGKVYYANSIASSYSYSNTAVCNSRSGNYFVVKPNSSTAARTCTVTLKNSAGEVVGYVYIKQSGVPTKTINAACTGGNYTHGISGVYSATSNNTSICSGLTSDKKSLIVKPSTSTSVRNCRVTLKNSAGRIVAYVYIKQSAVPVKYATVSGNGSAKLSYRNSKASNFSYSSKYVSKITASNPGSFTIYFHANPSTTKTRSFDIIAKDSKGVYVEIIRVTQQKFTPLIIQ